MQGTVLVLDTEAEVGKKLGRALQKAGHVVETESDPARAASLALRSDVEVVFVDERMSVGGVTLAAKIGASRPDVPVVVLTTRASVGAAVERLRAGACDVVVRTDVDAVSIAVERALRQRRIAGELHRLRGSDASLPGLVGESEATQRLREVIARIGPTQVTVLITGEPGTGKELVARALHAASARAAGPFVGVHCASVPSALLESELFGHASGAFTDARSSRRGRFVEAEGGTLFLEAIDELPLDLQTRLVRALQERTVRPVGGREDVPFDTRLVVATHRDLATEVRDRRFREDLFYRIHACGIDVPPLRERTADIPELVRAFVERAAAKHHRELLGVAPAAMRALLEHRWPGNVRELATAIERAALTARGPQIGIEDLPENVKSPSYAVDSSLLPTEVGQLVSAAEIERRYIAHVLAVVKGNKSRAARILQLDRRTLYRKLERTSDVESGEIETASLGVVGAPQEPERERRRA